MSPFTWPCWLSPHKPTQFSDTVGHVLVLVWFQWAGMCRPKSTHCIRPTIQWQHNLNWAPRMVSLCLDLLVFNWIMFVFAGSWKNEDWTVCRCCSQDCWEFPVWWFNYYYSGYTCCIIQSVYYLQANLVCGPTRPTPPTPSCNSCNFRAAQKCFKWSSQLVCSVLNLLKFVTTIQLI